MSPQQIKELWKTLVATLGQDSKVILKVAMAYSEQLHHYYLGTEHLFMAMAKLDGSLTHKVLAAMNETSKDVRDRLKRLAGPGYKESPWEGMIPTPRLMRTLKAAFELASDEGYPHIGERHLLLAILEDEDSLPARLFRSMSQEKHCDVSLVLNTAKSTTWSPPPEGVPPYDLKASFGRDAEDPLPDQQEDRILEPHPSNGSTPLLNKNI